MNYAKINNTTLITYPYGFTEFQQDNLYTIYPRDSDFVSLFPNTDIAKQGYTLIEVTEVTQPSVTYEQDILEGIPELIAGIWTQTWVITNATVDEIATRFLALQNAAIATIEAQASTLITNGFSSSALGSPFTYPSLTTDQNNLTANVLSSFYPNLPSTWTTNQICNDPAGAWNYIPHTAAQIQQVGLDAKANILAVLVRNTTAKIAIMAATTLEAIQAVVL